MASDVERLTMPRRARASLGSSVWGRAQRFTALMSLLMLAGAFGCVGVILCTGSVAFGSILVPEVFVLGLSMALLGTSGLSLLFWYPLIAAWFVSLFTSVAPTARDAIAHAEDSSSGLLVGLFIGLEILLTGGTFFFAVFAFVCSPLGDSLLSGITAGAAITLIVPCCSIGYILSLLARPYRGQYLYREMVARTDGEICADVMQTHDPTPRERSRQMTLRQEVMNVAAKTHLLLLIWLGCLGLCMGMGLSPLGGAAGRLLAVWLAVVAGCVAIALLVTAIITTREDASQEVVTQEHIR